MIINMIKLQSQFENLEIRSCVTLGRSAVGPGDGSGVR